MNKSVIIIIGAIWLLCTMYMALAKVNDYPYRGYAMAGSWGASVLLLACIIIYVKKHKRENNGRNTRD